MSNSELREDIRERILTLGPCAGPYDIPHRCSALHCDHCGICDVSEEFMSLISAHERALLDRVEKEVIGDGEPHVSHVCPQDPISCHGFQARSELRAEQRTALQQVREGL